MESYSASKEWCASTGIANQARQGREQKRTVFSLSFLQSVGDERGVRILLAKVFLEFLVGNPLDGPTAGPASSVRPWIIDSHFIPQRVQVGPRKFFDQVERFGMGKAATRHPELLIEADGIHDQRVAFPSSNRGSVVAGDSFGSCRRRDVHRYG